MTLAIRLLGGFQIARDGRPLAEPPSARTVRLLALLVLRAGVPQPRARVAVLFWPESTDSQARASLRKQIADLWRVLPEPGRFIETDGPDLLWRDDAPYTLDVAEFLRAAGDEGAAERAVALYGGELLPEFDEPWIGEERARLHRRYTRCLIAAIDAAEGREAWEEARAYARRLVALDPLDEDACRRLMRLEWRAGERIAALRAYHACAAALESELGVEPEEATRALYEQIQRDARRPPAIATPPVATARGSNQPLTPRPLPLPPTALLGRERELGLLATLLGRAQPRLVTLTGPGGIGKTSLALRLAERLTGAFRDGVAFVPLAALADPDLVLPTIAQHLGLTDAAGDDPAAYLAAALRARALFLVLDNFEQIAEAAPAIGQLVAACPELKVLVTSRVPLHLRGEHEFLVSPLPIPESGPSRTLADLATIPATALFLERAEAADPAFAPSKADAATIGAICRRLDGLPLAIELAAARVKLLPPAALLARLGSRLNLLTGGPRDLPARQQTLRATLNWSHGLLTPAEQHLFARLAVFVGGWTLDAAEAVCADDEGAAGSGVILDGLGSLLDKSMVRREAGDDPNEARYTMLETIREYAAERLAESGDGETLRERHAAFFLDLAGAARGALTGPQAGAWSARLEREHDNLRALLTRTAERGDTEIGLRLGGDLWRFWDMRGHCDEGSRWLAHFLADGRAADSANREAALFGAGHLAATSGDPAAALRHFTALLALAEKRGDEDFRGDALTQLGHLAQDAGDLALADAHYQEALAIRRALGRSRGSAITLSSLGQVAILRADYAQARTYLDEARAIVERAGMLYWAPTIRLRLGWIACEEGEFPAARDHFGAALETYTNLGDRRSIAICLVCFAVLAAHCGDDARAVELAAAAEALRDTVRATVPAHWLAWARRALAPCRARLTDAEIAHAEAHGIRRAHAGIDELTRNLA